MSEKPKLVGRASASGRHGDRCVTLSGSLYDEYMEWREARTEEGQYRHALLEIAQALNNVADAIREKG